jgi:hypothetical protein
MNEEVDLPLRQEDQQFVRLFNQLKNLKFPQPRGTSSSGPHWFVSGKNQSSDTPVLPGSEISRGQACVMLLDYLLENHLNRTAVHKLLVLLKLLFPESSLPGSLSHNLFLSLWWLSGTWQTFTSCLDLFTRFKLCLVCPCDGTSQVVITTLF